MRSLIGHSQFERIPLSYERQERIIQEQIDETLAAIEELKANAGENFSIKQMEKTRKTLETKLEKAALRCEKGRCYHL